MSVAAEELTGFEIIAIEKQFGKDLADLSAPLVLIGMVWAFSNRDGKSASWADVKAMSVRQLNGFFEPEPVEPDGEQGKG